MVVADGFTCVVLEGDFWTTVCEDGVGCLEAISEDYSLLDAVKIEVGRGRTGDEKKSCEGK